MDGKESFQPDYLKEIRYYCLVMSSRYIENHFSDIKRYACEVEKRVDDTWCTKQFLLEETSIIWICVKNTSTPQC